MCFSTSGPAVRSELLQHVPERLQDFKENLVDKSVQPHQCSPGCIGALGGTGFEVQEFQEPTGTESRHTRGHLDGSFGIIGSATDEQFEV